MSVLAQRFFYGTLLLAGALLLLGYDYRYDDNTGLFILTMLLGGGGWLEWVRLTGLRGWWPRWGGLALLIGTVTLQWWWLRSPDAAGSTLALVLPPLIPLLLPGSLVLLALRERPGTERLAAIALATLGFVYLVYPILCCLRLRSMEHGELWILLLVLLVKGNDIGAYLTGRKLGRTPLIKVSPKKTVEGTVGGLLLGVVVALAFPLLGAEMFTLVEAVGIALVAGVAGQVGDLAESFLKRSVGVKDSGALIPAFGGVLDLLDSLLFAGPLLYLFAVLLNGS